MAQYFPKKKFVDIAAFDDGRGIPGSLKSANIGFSSDENAIEQALYGTSSKQEDGFRGRGLPSSRQIISEALKGNLCIFSMCGGVLISPSSSQDNVNKDLYHLDEYGLQGTLVHCRFKVLANQEINIYPWL